MALVMIDVQ